MAAGYYLRKIELPRWFTDPNWVNDGFYNEPDWLPGGTLPADCVSDLNTKSGALSLYWLSDGDEEAALRIGVALNARRPSLYEFEYCLIPDTVIAELGMQTERLDGTTPDNTVNSWHWDLIQLNATSLVSLASEIKRRPEMRRVVFKPDIVKGFRDALDNGWLEERKVHDKLLQTYG